MLYEPNAPETLANAIEELLLDPERARELGRSGREAVLKNFSVEQMSRGVMEVLEGVMRKT